jgi:hypothetical protein
MCRPAGAHFEGHGIGYKYAAPLGLSKLNALTLSRQNMNAKGIREAQYFVLDTSILATRGAQSAPIPAGEARSERDSSGTTRDQREWVMERIAPYPSGLYFLNI